MWIRQFPIYELPIYELAVQVIDCSFVEIGISRSNKSQTLAKCKEKYCSAIVVSTADNIIFNGCKVEGCVGQKLSYALTSNDVDELWVKNFSVTDLFSEGIAKTFNIEDSDVEVIDMKEESVISDVKSDSFEYMLDNHVGIGEEAPRETGLPN